MNRSMNMPRMRAGFALACTCAALSLPAQDADARTLAEVKSLSAISMCANRDALPYASNKPDAPGFQIEIGRAIAEGLGVPLNIEWILPRRRGRIHSMLSGTPRPSAMARPISIWNPGASGLLLA